MAKKATAADAELILKLYDLRREAELRKARKWWGSFWPQSADDVLAVASAYSIPENAWFRQVLGYWDMAATLVLRGALNEDLFFDNCSELWFTYAKFSPYLKEIRIKMKSPEFLGRLEKMVTKSKEGRDRLKKMEARAEGFRKMSVAKAE